MVDGGFNGAWRNTHFFRRQEKRYMVGVLLLVEFHIS